MWEYYVSVHGVREMVFVNSYMSLIFLNYFSPLQPPFFPSPPSLHDYPPLHIHPPHLRVSDDSVLRAGAHLAVHLPGVGMQPVSRPAGLEISTGVEARPSLLSPTLQETHSTTSITREPKACTCVNIDFMLTFPHLKLKVWLPKHSTSCCFSKLAEKLCFVRTCL